MNFKTLVQELLTRQKSGKQISGSNYPSSIYLPSNVHEQLSRIAGFTDKATSRAGKIGSTGWEYGLQVVYFIDELYTSKPIAGDYSSVSIGGKVSVQPQYTDNNQKIYFDISVGEKEYKSPKYNPAKIQDPLFSIAATFHTHPRYYHGDGTFQYTFFSPQDVASLVKGKSLFSGLIAGNKVWIACKTKDSRMISPVLLSTATRLELQEDNEAVKRLIKNEMKEFGIVFYFGTLRGRLERV